MDLRSNVENQARSCTCHLGACDNVKKRGVNDEGCSQPCCILQGVGIVLGVGVTWYGVTRTGWSQVIAKIENLPKHFHVNPLDTIQHQGTLQVTWLEHSLSTQHIPFFPLFSFPFFSLSIHSDSTFHYSILWTQVLHKLRSLPMFAGTTEDMPISRKCQARSCAFQVW